jgi:hypothetical protein
VVRHTTEYYLRWAANARVDKKKLERSAGDEATLRLNRSALYRVPIDDVTAAAGQPLTGLGLAHNFISSVSACLHRLPPGLKSLDLSYNLIAAFVDLPRGSDDSNGDDEGEGVGRLPRSLTELNLAHNVIERLPRHLASLANLHVLNVAHNNLTNDLGTRVCVVSCRVVSCVRVLCCVVRVLRFSGEQVNGRSQTPCCGCRRSLRSTWPATS